MDVPADDLAARSQHRCTWAAGMVHETTDGAKAWNVISPDLTRNDKSGQNELGRTQPDNIGVEFAGVVFAIAESPKEKGEIWAGTNDGSCSSHGTTALDQRHGEHPGRARSWERSPHQPSRWTAGSAHHGRWPSGERPRSVGIQDDGFRPDVEQDREGRSQTSLSVRTRSSAKIRQRGLSTWARKTDCTSRSMMVRTGSRCRRSPHAPVYRPRCRAISRSGDRDVRARLLDPGRSRAALPGWRQSNQRKTSRCSSPAISIAFAPSPIRSPK